MGRTGTSRLSCASAPSSYRRPGVGTTSAVRVAVARTPRAPIRTALNSYRPAGRFWNVKTAFLGEDRPSSSTELVREKAGESALTSSHRLSSLGSTNVCTRTNPGAGATRGEISSLSSSLPPTLSPPPRAHQHKIPRIAPVLIAASKMCLEHGGPLALLFQSVYMRAPQNLHLWASHLARPVLCMLSVLRVDRRVS